MSRSRMAVAALLVPVAAGAVALLGAGAASAVTPYSGDGYVGVRFDQNETRFLSDTNTADFLNAIPGEYWGVYSGEDRSTTTGLSSAPLSASWLTRLLITKARSLSV